MAKISVGIKSMNVLKATPAKRNELDGYRSGVNRLEFALDDLGNYVIGKQCSDDPAFAAIKTDLKAMAEIEFVPKREAAEVSVK